MKPLPPGLPPANSRKWHSRRRWDGLGYLRVRTLANPNWQRDIRWLIAWLRRESETAPPADRTLYDQAIAAAQRYCHVAHHDPADEHAWDQILVPIDELLMRRQLRHLADVHDAQSKHRRHGGCDTTDQPLP